MKQKLESSQLKLDRTTMTKQKESFLCKNNWSLSEIELIIKALITMIMISNNNKKTNWT